MSLSQIQTDTISISSVNNFLDNLDKAKNYSPASNTCTRNGFQTHNIISSIHISALEEIYNKVQAYLKTVIKNCIYYEFYIDYMHLIHYNNGGWQVGHTHSEYEDYSFILYLNDSDGDTVIYEGKDIIRITPERGKIVFFDSNYYHESSICSKEKKVAVGSIKFRHKIWEPKK